MIDKLYKSLIRKYFKITKRRPDGYPFISGDGFRKMADHIYDETNKKTTPEKIKEGEIIFVNADMLESFFKNIHPKIECRYKLISHNSDKNITEIYEKYIDEKIIHWFGQNLMFEHPKISAIPIGIENLHFYNKGIVKNFTKELKNKREKISKILFGFTISTNLIKRKKAWNELKNNKNAHELKPTNDHKQYLSIINRYKFIASPPGNGIDCIRTWESIILDTIPVCLENQNSIFFKEMGVPIKLVKNFTEMNNFTKNEIDSEYKNIIKNSNKNLVTFDYWYDIIKNHD